MTGAWVGPYARTGAGAGAGSRTGVCAGAGPAAGGGGGRAGRGCGLVRRRTVLRLSPSPAATGRLVYEVVPVLDGNAHATSPLKRMPPSYPVHDESGIADLRG